MNTDIQRVNRIVEWLIFERIVDNRRDLAEKLGYTESSLSQILNGKVSLSVRFINKISNLDERINEDWILTGEGEMIKKPELPTGDPAQNVMIPREAWEVIRDQAASLKAKDESLKIKDQQVSEVISILKEQIKKGEDAGENGHAAPGAALG